MTAAQSYAQSPARRKPQSTRVVLFASLRLLRRRAFSPLPAPAGCCCSGRDGGDSSTVTASPLAQSHPVTTRLARSIQAAAAQIAAQRDLAPSCKVAQGRAAQERGLSTLALWADTSRDGPWHPIPSPGSPDASTTRTRASSGRMSSRRSERSSRSKSGSRSARSRLPNGGICRHPRALRAQTATTTMP